MVIHQAGYRTQCGSSDNLVCYSYNFDRPNQYGTPQDNEFRIGDTGFKTVAPGIGGVWHRLELEVKLCTPSLAEAADARRRTTHIRPTGGDGFQKVWITKDIDNELGGGVGARTLVAHLPDLIHFPWRDDVTGPGGVDYDDMHTKACIAGFWVHQIYGGGPPCQADVWSWIRRIEVYRHD
jgi:hypothetical protein